MAYDQYKINEKPFYIPVKDEVDIFRQAFAEKVPLLLKGPTGCGKTRFVEYMSWVLGQQAARKTNTGEKANGLGSLFTVSCHEDLTARDLIGRYIIKGGEAVWVDGPAAMAVKAGGILYLDEVVEARKDVAVVLHPLTDYRRILPMDTLGTQIQAPHQFMVIVSYNPGYQSIRKNLKPSTKQRFIAIDFDYPPPEKEMAIVASEGGIDNLNAEKLVRLAGDIRSITAIDLEEGVSTRGLIHAAKLIKRGLPAKRACSLAIAQSVSDDKEEISAVELVIDKIFR